GEAEQLRHDLAGGLRRQVTLVNTVSPSVDSLDIKSFVTEADASVLVLGRQAAGTDTIIDQAARLHADGLRVRLLLTFYEEWVGKLPISELQRSSFLFDISDVHRTRYRRMARVMDIAASLLIWPFFLLVLPIVFVGNLIGNRGPLFFRQPRVGKAGAEFQIVKLRTMTPGSESTEWTSDADDRITRFGQILRRSHIDELPQLINILRGDISVVGPRPEQPHYVEQLKASIPFYDLRHIVQPGLTGWAQVNYGYGNTTMDALEKLQYEFYYLRHPSLWLDLQIVARTLQSVIGRKGR
ncbi:MAG: sugar transferase, partial [Acidimicrobiales bacterium]